MKSFKEFREDNQDNQRKYDQNKSSVQDHWKKTKEFNLSEKDIKTMLVDFAKAFLADYEKENVGAPEALVDDWFFREVIPTKMKTE